MSDFFKLYNKNELDFFKKFEFFFDKYKEKYELEEVLPFHYKEKYNEEKSKALEKAVDLDRDYNYYDMFQKQDFVFDSLKRSKIDGLLLLAYKEIESNETILNNLDSFKPKNSYCKRIIYNRVETLTGRLTVKSGPRILTLPSRCRNIIKSRFEKGNIVNIDFKSLEPRIMSYISNNKYSDDIYEDIHSQLSFETDRSVIKRAVISLTYGSSINNIENLSSKKTKEISNVINSYFNFNKIISIAKETDRFGYRRNYFGRPIHNLKQTNERKILNNFIQSTAVDISLNFFCELIKKVNVEKAVPLFIIHDAIVFDVSSDYEDSFLKIANIPYENRLGKFPLELTKIDRRKT